MTTDFEIEDNYALWYRGQLLDLHNNFEFVGFQYDTETKEFKLTWRKANGDWVKDDEAEGLDLIHKSVSYVSIGDKDVDGRLEDDNCLGDLTFFPSIHRDDNDNIVDQRQPTKDDDILYSFESGRKIRICCEAIELVLRVENGPQHKL